MLAPPKQLSTTQSFVNASNELDEVCAWMEKIGIGFSGTRIAKYKAIFAAMAAAERAEDLEGFFKKNTRMEFLNAIVERAQLVRIYAGLHGIHDSKLAERLKKTVRSHALFVMDSEPRSGRDFSLELDVAAKFSRGGYEIDFGHDADVKACKGDIEIFVECKRLKSESNISNNIRKGLKQLKNRYKSSRNADACRGILVLSIGKIVNPEFGYLEGENVREIGDQCGTHVNAFLARYSRYWHHPGVDQKTLGVALVLDSPGRTLERNIPFSLHEVAFNNIVLPSFADHAHLVEIMRAFEPQSRAR